METINEIIAAVEEPPESFEQYLTSYADRVGDLVNSFIPKGTHADMDRYLYQPLMAYSQNGGKRHRPLICFAACRAVGGDMARATSAAAACFCSAVMEAVSVKASSTSDAASALS